VAGRWPSVPSATTLSPTSLFLFFILHLPDIMNHAKISRRPIEAMAVPCLFAHGKVAAAAWEVASFLSLVGLEFLF
jgi:hypothetical protein